MELLNSLFYEHVDYILLLYGLSLFKLGAVCLSLKNRSNHDLPWNLLIFFGVVGGIATWLQLLSVSLGDKNLWIELRTALLFLAGLCLWVFGRNVSKKQRPHIPDYWIPGLLLVLLFICLMRPEEYPIVGRVVFFGGTLLAGFSLLVSVGATDGKPHLLSVSMGFLLFSLAGFIGLAVPYLLYPLTLLQGVAMIATSIAILKWQGYCCAPAEVQIPKGQFKYCRRTGLIMVGIVLLGWILTAFAGNYAEDNGRNILLSRTRAVQSAISPEQLKLLTGTLEDIGTPAYEDLKKQLSYMRDMNKDFRFIYLFTKQDDKVIFLVDSEPEHSQDYSAPGDSYEEGTEVFRKGVEVGEPFVEGPSTDQWGTWVSGHAPIKDKATQKVIAFVGVDMDARYFWVHQVAIYRLTVIVAFSIIIPLTIALLVISRRNEEASRHIAALQLKESDDKYRVLFHKTAHPILIINNEGNYLDGNDAALDFLECTREELLNQNATQNLPPGREHVVGELCSLLRTGGIIEREYLVRGKTKVMELTITPVELQGRCVIFGLGKDITERKKAQEKITCLAYYDTLTGLPNRVKFHESLANAIVETKDFGKLLAVMFLDLDRFKNVNDSLGHPMGDQLLKEVAKRIKESIGPKDLVARLGGDEFTILAEVETIEQAVNLAQHVLEQFQIPFTIGGTEVHISTSIGVTFYPKDGNDVEALLKNADTAMYQAKELGRDNYQLFVPTMKKNALKNLQLEHDFLQGLDQGQFVVYYQPQFDVATGRINGAEALVRWQHPQFGMLMPGEFIPLAEEAGLIVQLGEWVLRSACAQNKAWQDAGLPAIRVAVNLSARHFLQDNLLQRVVAILSETGLAPEWLELEITESVTMGNLEYTLEVLQELKALGVHIAIDDFGMGYCSLNYLKHLHPIDTLKIDRIFIKDIDHAKGNRDRAIVSALIALGKKLQLRVIAEGVETPEQFAFLKMQQSDGVQGFLFTKPISAEEFQRYWHLLL